MRQAILVLAGLICLAGCTYAERNQVSASPPTVSYRVAGNDLSQANAAAEQYCQRYSAGAVYQGLQATPAGNVAVYNCSGPPQAATVAPPPYDGSGSTVPPYSESDTALPADAPPPGIECATPLRQDLPGGTDYSGPPVPQCPTPQY